MLELAQHGSGSIARWPVEAAGGPGRRGEDRAQRILLVEDNPGDALLAERALSGRSSFEVERAVSLSEACRKLRGEFDAVLLDLRLPDGSRLDSLRRVRGVAPGVPIVALTGIDDAELARACIDAGAQDYIRKSELSELVLPRVLQHAIARQRSSELSQRLELAEQHAALGRIATSVAHEINNQTAAALASAEHARALLGDLRPHVSREGAPLLDEAGEALTDQIACIDHVTRFVGELKGLGRLGDGEAAPVDVEIVIRRTVRMLENRLQQVARVELDLRGIPSTLATEQKLTQVLMNLLLNAADAIERARPEENRIAVRTERRGARIAVSVEDTGRGIPPEAHHRLFQPFFTNKAKERGVGLGLAISREIVIQLGGELEVESEPGRGTTFTLLLPIAHSPSRKASRAARPMQPRARARVLLIDDQEPLRRALSRLLERTHDVDTAESGAAGLERLEADQGYDAILCDVMMPGLDGPGLAEALAERHPDLTERLVFLSGGAFDERARKFVEESGCPVVEKPATREQLLDAIEAVRPRRQVT